MSTLIMPKKCIRISERFMRAINKYGNSIELNVLKKSEPKNQYEFLYGQSVPDVDEIMQFKSLLRLNPPESSYKDLHLETRGDAVLLFMAYSMQEIGIIDNTLDSYFSIPNIIIGNHVVIGENHYRIDEVKQTNLFMEFPLVVECSLKLVDDEIPIEEEKPDSGEESGVGDCDVN